MKVFKTAVFKKIFYNAGILASGSVLSSLIGLLSFALIARVLGSELFGILALVQAYTLIIDKIMNFQSWQALIKFGAGLLGEKTKTDFTNLLKFGFVLDITTAVIACIVGICLPYFIGSWLGWSEIKVEMASLFAVVILFNIEGTPTAILRLFDNFKQFSIASILAALLKLILVVVGYIFEYGLIYFVVITMIAQVFGYVYLLISSIYLLKGKEISLVPIPTYNEIKRVPVRFKGLWSFIWTTNFHGTVRMTSLNLDTVLVDVMLGSSSTGLYQVAKQFAKVFTQVSQPLYKSIYPELTKLWANRKTKEFRNVLVNASLLATGFGVISWSVFLFFGKTIIKYSVGIEYLDSLPVLLWYLSGVVVSISTFSITPAILAMGYPKLSFKALLIATILYFFFFWLTINYYGLTGAGISYLLLYLFWLMAIGYFYFKEVRIKKEQE